MVRGVSRRVVVVKPQESCYFEQAIFILKDDLSIGTELKSEEMIKEACATAQRYMKKNGSLKKLRFSPTFFLAVGAGATGALWMLCTLFT